MKKLKIIVIGQSVLLIIIGVLSFWRGLQEEPQIDHTQERDHEIELMKIQIRQIHEKLDQEYEKIDTISTVAGAVNDLNSFIERTGGELPPGFD